MRARFLKPAQAEVEEAVTYFDEQRTGLGDRFEQDLLDSVGFLTEFPFTGKPISDVVRRFPLRTFKYNLIYAMEDDEVVIIAVAHHRRRPGYWQRRLALLR